MKAIKFYKARWQEMVKPYFDQNEAFEMPKTEGVHLT